jgi:uncharacterized protein (TIGR02594 family)
MVPSQYDYLRKEPLAPLLVRVALDLYGTKEVAGSADNPIILSWADEVAQGTQSNYANWATDFYNDDAIPWCGLFVAVCAVRSAQGNAARLPEHKYLSALEWRNWGVPVDPKDAVVGDVGISQRNGGGHVFIIVGEDATHYHILGGNQSDQVNIVRKAKADVIYVRRPPYINRPAGARKVLVNASGAAAAGSEA